MIWWPWKNAAAIERPSLIYWLFGHECDDCHEIVRSYDEHCEHIDWHMSVKMKDWYTALGWDEEKVGDQLMLDKERRTSNMMMLDTLRPRW